jgi:hypothetical protein
MTQISTDKEKHLRGLDHAGSLLDSLGVNCELPSLSGWIPPVGSCVSLPRVAQYLRVTVPQEYLSTSGSGLSFRVPQGQVFPLAVPQGHTSGSHTSGSGLSFCLAHEIGADGVKGQMGSGQMGSQGRWGQVFPFRQMGSGLSFQADGVRSFLLPRRADGVRSFLSRGQMGSGPEVSPGKNQ